MKREQLYAQPPSEQELRDLAKLKLLIERAVADGKISQAEMESIKAVMIADGKVTFEELELCQHLIWSKIRTGELEYSW